jgi:hypothetical protein
MAPANDDSANVVGIIGGRPHRVRADGASLARFP